MVQVVEGLPSKCEALSSTLSTTKKKKERKKETKKEKKRMSALFLVKLDRNISSQV
jgi:hypothetical protein